MKKYLIKKPEKYTQNGVEKTIWHTVGRLVMFEKDGTLYIPAIGLDAKVYEIEEKAPEPTKIPNTDIDYPEPSGEEIPF